VQGLEQFRELGILVDRPHRFHETRPVGGLEHSRLAVLLENLGENDQLVVDALALLALLHAMGGEGEQIFAPDFVDIRLAAEALERSEDGPVGAEGS